MALDSDKKYVQYIHGVGKVNSDMELLHFEASIDFSEEDISESISAKVRAVLTGKKPSPSDVGPEAGVTVTSTREKSKISWNHKRCRFLFESEPNLIKCADNVLSLLGRIQSVAPITAIKETRFDMCWMLPALGYSFVTLELKYREAMIMPYEELMLGISDSSVLFDADLAGIHLHHQSGAMGPGQLTMDYLDFEYDGDLPEAFMFLTTRVSSKELVQYSESAVRQHFTKLVQCSENHSKLFEHIWRDVL